MSMRQFDYAAPGTVEQAIGLLSGQDSAVALAGGQCVVPEMRMGRRQPSLLVDLRRLDGLRAIRMGEGGNGSGGLWLGAMVTLDQVAGSALAVEGFTALAEAADAVGDQQVRNHSTIGGALVNSRQGADLPPALVALGAEIETVGSGGRRLVPVETAVAGLGPGTIVTAIRLPAALARAGSAYQKMRDPASCYAICGVAASVRVAENGSLAECRVAVTGVAPGVVRLGDVESALVGSAPTARRISSQLHAAAGRLRCISDMAASGEYRGHLVAVLGERALRQALARAGLALNGL
jgi:aerobic carbon-monoxide dehydrogenase medium subunit